MLLDRIALHSFFTVHCFFMVASGDSGVLGCRASMGLWGGGCTDDKGCVQCGVCNTPKREKKEGQKPKIFINV